MKYALFRFICLYGYIFYCGFIMIFMRLFVEVSSNFSLKSYKNTNETLSKSIINFTYIDKLVTFI